MAAMEAGETMEAAAAAAVAAGAAAAALEAPAAAAVAAGATPEATPEAAVGVEPTAAELMEDIDLVRALRLVPNP